MHRYLDISDVVGIIIGGGEGSRMFELTETRGKLMVPLAGTLKQISPTINNMNHSKINRLYILTQYQPVSFNNYIKYHWANAWGNGEDKNLEVIQAFKSRQEREDWFFGSADALRMSSQYWNKSNPEIALLASVDHLYNMDYRDLVIFAKETNADFVLSATKIPFEEGKDKGVLELEKDGNRVLKIHEKQETYPSIPNDISQCFVNMGVYAGNPKVIMEILRKYPEIHDIGGQLVPKLIELGYNVQAYDYTAHKIPALKDFTPYWMDIGTIGAYVEAHKLLQRVIPPIDIFSSLRSYREGSPAKIKDANQKTYSILGNAIVNGSIESCTLGNKVVVHHGAILKDVIAFGKDPWEYHEDSTTFEEGCMLERVILDKEIFVPSWVRLSPETPMGLDVRDGYVIVPKKHVFTR